MSLPEILPPDGTPVFLAADHSIALQDVYADFRFRTGHGRKRRLSRTAPRDVSVSWFLEEDQMVAVDDWFENALDVGNRHFTAQVANQGQGLLYWDAQWREPYVSTPLHLGRWKVTGTLRLIGDGSVSGPANTSAEVEFVARLLATASVVPDGAGEVEFSAALEQATLAAVEFGAALIHVPPSYELREDGGLELREDGGTEQRE